MKNHVKGWCLSCLCEVKNGKCLCEGIALAKMQEHVRPVVVITTVKQDSVVELSMFDEVDGTGGYVHGGPHVGTLYK